jgi:hypothetical protein
MKKDLLKLLTIAAITATLTGCGSSGCSGEGCDQPDPTPTATATPIPTPTATATPIPTSTPIVDDNTSSHPNSVPLDEVLP